MENFNPYAIIIILAVIAFFVLILTSGRKLKEYAVYGVDGEILHLWRRQQNIWFEFGDSMVFYEDAGGNVLTIIQRHWVKRYKRLNEPSDWARLLEEEQKKKSEE